MWQPALEEEWENEASEDEYTLVNEEEEVAEEIDPGEKDKNLQSDEIANLEKFLKFPPISMEFGI